MSRWALVLAVMLATAVEPARAGPGDDALAAYSGRDYATALRLWRPLADQGDASAEFWVGACYDLGHGVAADPAVAVQWYRKAAEQGHANAQHNLGNLYEVAQGVSPDYALTAAATWYRRAAEQGYRPAQANLGALYYSGRGVRRDLVQAYKWFALAGGTENRDHVAKRLSARQLEEAEALVRAWQAKPER
jgi:TPR repeat protein